MELSGKVISFLGDSITEGYGCSEPSKTAFPALLEKRYGLKRANNYGIGGTRIARQVNHVYPIDELDFCVRCTEMDPESDVIVVMGGTNDHGHGDAPFGTFTDRTPDTFCGACHFLMKTLLETYPDAVIVICTPLHNLGENNERGVMDASASKRPPLSVFADMIRETATYYSFPLLDLWKMSGLQPGVDVVRERYFLPDGCHPNDAGHAVLADRIGAFLSVL